jgi:MFS family permease
LPIFVSEMMEPGLLITSILGFTQILLWGASYFLLSVLSKDIMRETGWSYQMVYGCLSLSLFVSGLLLPRIGRMIHTQTHNHALFYTGLVMAAGLVITGLASSYWLFAIGWCVIGIAMGMGLYDALFASLGKRYGTHANRAIVWVTLIASLAPSVAWALSSLLLTHFGWRNTCFIYAGILVVTIFPLHRYVFTPLDSKAAKPAPGKVPVNKIFYLLAISFTIGAVMTTGLVVHLIDILLEKQMPMSTVLMVAAFLGPSQAAARTLELLIRNRNAIEMAFISTFAMLLGLVLLFYFPISGVIIFGVGNGMRSVLRGTLPLYLYGKDIYPLVIGKLARMPLIAQAATPFIGGFIIQQWGTDYLVYTLCMLAVINISLIWRLNKTTYDFQKGYFK